MGLLQALVGQHVGGQLLQRAVAIPAAVAHEHVERPGLVLLGCAGAAAAADGARCDKRLLRVVIRVLALHVAVQRRLHTRGIGTERAAEWALT